MLTLGIALGSGAARGWSHVGVIEALLERGLQPSVVAGASVGSLVGAAYAADKLDDLKTWILSLRRLDVVRLLDARLLSGGLMKGSRVMDAVGDLLTDREIGTLDKQFGAVATDLESGREIWLRDGSLLTAVRASSGLPGLFAPMQLNGRWLVDGGVVNPVPVSLCHALGADIVIAVNLNAFIMSRRQHKRASKERPAIKDGEQSQLDQLTERIGGWWRASRRERDDDPTILDVVGASVNIMQDRITRSRMVGEPPEVVIMPHMQDFQLMDFHRAEDAIEAGRLAVQSADVSLSQLEKQLNR